MATDRQYFEQLHDIAELKRYIRHLEQRMIYNGLISKSTMPYFRSAYLDDKLAREVDCD